MINDWRKMLLPLRKLANRFANPQEDNEQTVCASSQDTIIYKAAEFVAVNKVRGDYLEFGVFQGGSFISAYHTLRYCFDNVVNRFGFTMSELDRATTASIVSSMRFFAFDSFEGLPSAADTEESGFFKKGQFSAGLDEFCMNLAAAGIPPERRVIVNGWYDKTLTNALYERHCLTQAAIVHIDCDLYESTRLVLGFIAPLLVDGTILIFDDWFHFNGHPSRGEQKAFYEWTATLKSWSFSEFQQEGTWRKSFIANKH